LSERVLALSTVPIPSARTVARMKNGCKPESNISADEPTLNIVAESKRPAHVGHAVNRPQAAPTPRSQRAEWPCGLFSY
jgi:hypothetical protein